jgi:hypothetical protein
LESWLDRAGEGIVWADSLRQVLGSGHSLAGLVQIGIGQYCAQRFEEHHYEQAYHAASKEVQAGEGLGSVIWLEMPELGARGWANVVANEVCPEIYDGPGQPVTATFVHGSAEILDLVFEPTGRFSNDGRLFPVGTEPALQSSSSLKSPGSSLTLGVTSAHPFWSVTRDDFVPAGELELFEQVVTIDGQLWRLTAITPRDGPETVYNFEVAREHVYYVGKDGLLVHNS